ncbi:hypothetical protein [Candidatus Avelusimicrobium gallicola]|uniref:Uncharacterized protein n=1 Tax=Candidatus Avelusimicrobium gallicola TaxID=2562704 RepID=A0A1Y4DEN2_9BACT|nr:hypothetical protein [Elusimicrobium sp. An273]OUO57584.1 hypothetical protein B5F75_02075 [Elusimicrobium sp. An273]
MKLKIREAILLVCALAALGTIPVFLSKDNPIEVSVPVLDAAKLAAKEAKAQKEAEESAAQAAMRRMVSCSVNEDCIIVDKDPCGCLVGPEGVTAINAAYTLDFNKFQSSLVTKACPEGAPSTERECSPSAQAVCQDNVCRISY